MMPKKDMPLWKRTMKCAGDSNVLSCGNIIDRDRIMINFLSQYGLWMAYNNKLTAMCCFVGNLRKTGLLIPTWIKSPIGIDGTLVGSYPFNQQLSAKAYHC